jgi:hypothetical protein
VSQGKWEVAKGKIIPKKRTYLPHKLIGVLIFIGIAIVLIMPWLEQISTGTWIIIGVVLGLVGLNGIVNALEDIKSALTEIQEELQQQSSDASPGLAPLNHLAEVSDHLERIGGILGGILASMPDPSRTAEPLSDWERLRASFKKPRGT